MTETPSDIPAVTTNIYNLLQPLKSDERQRVLKAALMMLGDDTAAAGAGSSSSKEQAHDGNLNLPAKAKAWMKKYEINAEQLGHVFHLDGNHEVIASEAPGGNSKLQTINSYVLTGILSLISTGEASFDDKTARKVCKSLGCFNEGNHSAYMRNKGNVLGGSKEAGWTLTGPGLKTGADLVKAIAGS
jgi:hypothetical protein